MLYRTSVADSWRWMRLDLAVRLEEFGRSGRIDGAADLVSELEVALGRARPIFAQLRGTA